MTAPLLFLRVADKMEDEMDYRKINDQITKEVAQVLHYIDNVDVVSKLTSARDIINITSGGLDRYNQDLIFRAKVRMLVASVMEVITRNEQT